MKPGHAKSPRKVLQIMQDGTVIQEFKSLSDAGKLTSCSSSTVLKQCKDFNSKNKINKNVFFIYKDDYVQK